jgi:hypothetical protein
MKGEVFVWDGSQGSVIESAGPGVLATAEAFDVYGGVTAAADFESGRVSMGNPGAGFAPCRVLTLPSLDQGGNVDKVGTAFALSTKGRAALASSQGTVGVVEMDLEGEKLTEIVKEQLTPFQGHPIDQIAWVDEGTLAIAGNGAIYLFSMKEDHPGEFSLEEPLAIDEKPSILDVSFVEVTDHLLAYGTSQSAPVIISLKGRCVKGAWERVLAQTGVFVAFYTTVATTLALLLTVLWRKRA